MAVINRVRKKIPTPRVRAVLTKSGVWRDTVAQLESYTAPFTVRLPKDYLADAGIVAPVNSFKVSLSRYAERKYRGKFQVYVVDGVIYITLSKSAGKSKSLKEKGE